MSEFSYNSYTVDLYLKSNVMLWCFIVNESHDTITIVNKPDKDEYNKADKEQRWEDKKKFEHIIKKSDIKSHNRSLNP